jgi:hypothetical protein
LSGISRREDVFTFNDDALLGFGTVWTLWHLSARAHGTEISKYTFVLTAVKIVLHLFTFLRIVAREEGIVEN